MTRDRVSLRTFAAGFAGLVAGMSLMALTGGGAAAQSGTQRTPIRPAKAPDTGLPYSPGVLVGNTLYVSGHLGRDPVTARAVTGGIEAETRVILADMREVLKAAGMDFNNVVSVNAYLTNLNDFPRFNAVYREFFPKDFPARTTVGVAGLNIGATVEMQMVAVK